MTNKNKQQGQALLLVLVFISAFAVTLIIGFQISVLLGQRTSRQSLAAVDTYALSEGGVEDTIMRLRRDPNIGLNSPQTLYLYDESGTVTTTVEPTAQTNGRRIISLGEINLLERKVQAELIISDAQEASFHYAVQIGNNGLTMYANSRIIGNAYSNGNIVGYSNSIIEGDAYAHGTISSPQPTVTGTKYEGEPQVDLPYIDIDYWKAQANINNDPIEGDYNYYATGETLGPKRINGSFNMYSNSSLTLTGPLYVTGNFEMNSNSILRLSEDFGSQGTIIVVDGVVRINSNTQILPTSADPKGYIMLLSTLNSFSPAAIELNSNATNGLIYAYNGAVQLNSNAHVTSVTGQQVILNSNAVLTYDQGLASAQFITGPGGGWAVLSWREVE